MDKTELEFEEYKLLQEKIDKIGEFRFQIKGWTVALASAILVATLGTGLSPWALLGAVPVVLSFQLLDFNQTLWQNAFIARVARIERSIARSARTPVRAPAVMREIALAHHSAKSSRRGRALLSAHRLFYALAYGTIAGVFLFSLLVPKEPEKAMKVSVSGTLNVPGASDSSLSKTRKAPSRAAGGPVSPPARKPNHPAGKGRSVP